MALSNNSLVSSSVIVKKENLISSATKTFHASLTLR
jgi:hypothetical protein